MSDHSEEAAGQSDLVSGSSSARPPVQIDEGYPRGYHGFMPAPPQSKGRGLSLLETTVAVQVIAGALLVVIGLFHAGMKARKETMQRKRATVAMRQAHTRLLSYSQLEVGGQYGFDDIRSNWTPTRNETLSTDSAFSVDYNVTLVPVYSPCTTFESNYDTDPERVILGERLQVEMVVRGLGQTARSLCWISDPPRELHPTNAIGINEVTVLDPLPRYVSPGGVDESEYEAVLYDKFNHPVTGATFRWDVIPANGNGTISWDQDLRDRDGRTGRLRNYITTSFGDVIYKPGPLRVECRSLYRGREVSQTRGPYVMNP